MLQDIDQARKNFEIILQEIDFQNWLDEKRISDINETILQMNSIV